MDHLTGSLEPGKQADLVIFDVGHPEWATFIDPVQALVWSVTSASIAETWVAGEPLFQNGSITTIPDEEVLREEARGRAEAIFLRAGLDRDVMQRGARIYE